MIEVKLFILMDNMIAYIEMLRNLQKCYGISDFRNVLGYIINVQKLNIFLYFSNKQL